MTTLQDSQSMWCAGGAHLLVRTRSLDIRPALLVLRWRLGASSGWRAVGQWGPTLAFLGSGPLGTGSHVGCGVAGSVGHRAAWGVLSAVGVSLALLCAQEACQLPPNKAGPKGSRAG